MTSPKSYQGSCFCGAVQFTVTGEASAWAIVIVIREWRSAAPINAFTLWQPENVRITRGEENIGTFSKTPQSNRKWCKTCGGHVFTEHPGLGLIDVYAAVIPDVTFIPGLHVNYSETKLPIRDGLLKLKDFPHGFGGSGIEVVE